jgi:hypothetical protein
MFVAAHKSVGAVPTEYEVVQAGASGKARFAALADDTGINISDKNGSYCEVTVLYWIWKNIHTDSLGLVHYRRFFSPSIWTKDISKVFSPSQLGRMLSQYDILLPKKEKNFKSNWDNFAEFHNIHDMEVVRGYIASESPDYLLAFDEVMYRQTSLYRYNMFVAGWDVFDAYMSWLMPILDYCYGAIDTSDYGRYNKRLIGFLAERLFNVWLTRNCNLKRKEIRISQIDAKISDHLYQVIRDCVKNVLFNLGLLQVRKKR